jgi:chemotaxis signal transduction protein
MITGITHEYLAGVVRMEENRLIILLKVEEILSTDEVVQLEQVHSDHIRETVDQRA